MKIIATQVYGYELMPGELFSARGPDYWDKQAFENGGLGEKVYIRMPTPLGELGLDPMEKTFRITVQMEEQ